MNRLSQINPFSQMNRLSRLNFDHVLPLVGDINLIGGVACWNGSRGGSGSRVEWHRLQIDLCGRRGRELRFNKRHAARKLGLDRHYSGVINFSSIEGEFLYGWLGFNLR